MPCHSYHQIFFHVWFSPAEVSIAEYQGPDCTLPPDLVAVKRLKFHVMKSEADVLDFIEEVRVLHKLDHQ